MSDITCWSCGTTLIPEEGDYETTYEEMLSQYGWYDDPQGGLICDVCLHKEEKSFGN